MNAIDTELRFTINGRPIVERDALPTTTLLEYLRHHLHLTGAKEGCAEGDCGACSVVVRDRVPSTGEARLRAMNACLVFLPAIHGKEITTVEGIATKEELHPVQRALVEGFGSQCGFCTPGFVASMVEAVHQSDFDGASADEQLAGNLCRCTGYRPIRDALHGVSASSSREHDSTMAPTEKVPRSLAYVVASRRYFAPTCFEDLVGVLDANPDARLVAGGTDVALEITKAYRTIDCVVSLERIADLDCIAKDDEGWTIGATATITDVAKWSSRELPVLAELLRWFGSRQIRHRATVGGNLCTASPVGDLAPVLLALDARVILRSKTARREISLDEFFVGYRKTALVRGEILESVRVPRPSANARCAAYKISKRREVDIATMSSAFRIELDAESCVTTARAAFGGMAEKPIRASRTEAALIGRPWTANAIEEAIPCLAEDLHPIDDLRGSAWYRMRLAENTLRQFFLETDEASKASAAGVELSP